MSRQENDQTVAALEKLSSQKDMQKKLENLRSGSLEPVLDELLEWSEHNGYFEHLKEENEYFSFQPDCTNNLRLQINYSRLGYKKPDDPNAPDCPLCFENIGIRGKEKLRAYEFHLAGRDVFIHLTPFPLYPGHFVLNNRHHEPMCIDRSAFELAHEFLDQVSGYLVASNSDVAWAGASVLDHHHLQIFRKLQLPIESAPAIFKHQVGNLSVSIPEWPCATIRVCGPDHEAIERAVSYLDFWKQMDAGKCTCNFLMRKNEDNTRLEITLILRHPDYRTEEKLRTIKAEGVGIIEMCGEAIVPPRPDLDRSGNRQFFQENGKSVVERIITDNGPRPTWMTQEWLSGFVRTPQAVTRNREFD